MQEQDATSRKSIQEKEDRKNEAVEQLLKSVRTRSVVDPVELFKRAVDIVVQFTVAKASYVAVVAEPEEPDAELEEDEAESDDDSDRLFTEKSGII